PSTHRMTKLSETNTTGITANTYQLDIMLLALVDTNSGGLSEVDLISGTDFGRGVLGTGLTMRNGQYREYAITGIGREKQARGQPQLEVLIVGRGIQPHRCEVFVGASASSLRSLGTRDFSPYTTVTVSETLDWTDIGSDGQLVVRVATLGDAATFDRVSLSY